MDGFPIPNDEESNWEFLPGVTPTVDQGHFDPSIELVLGGQMKI